MYFDNDQLDVPMVMEKLQIRPMAELEKIWPRR